TSQAPDGMLGAGWALTGLPRIERCGATIVDDGFRGGVGFGADDRFCLVDAGLEDPRLVPVSTSQSTYFTPGATYRPERETWTRIVASTTTCGGGPCSFTITLASGITLTLGTTTDSAVLAVAASSATLPAGVVRTWLVDSITDLDGNTVAITYTQSPTTTTGTVLSNPGAAVPARIDYTSRTASPAMAPMRSVQFSYQARPDPTASNQGGATVASNVTLAAIQTCIATSAATSVTGQTCTGGALQLAQQYALTYQQNAVTGRSQLAAVQQCDGAGNCLPATTFAWTAGADSQQAIQVPTTSLSSNTGWVADFNGDGKTDLLSQELSITCTGGTGTASGALFLASGNGFGTPACVYLPFANATAILPGDYNGDGLADVAIAQVGSITIYLYSASQGFTAQPAQSLQLAQTTQVGDVNGDGLADLVTASASQVTVLLSTGAAFTAQQAQAITLGQTVFVVDFTGDGRADLFTGAAANGTLYPSTGTGFGTGVAGSGLDLGNDETWAGDFTGDGIADLASADASNLYLMVGTGAGFASAVTFTGLDLASGSTWTGDFNGDGALDLYSVGLTSSTLWFAGAAATCAASNQAGPCFTSASAPGQNLTSSTTWLGDFNGDGADDLYLPNTTPGTSDTIYFAAQGGTVATQNQAPDLVTTIVDGLGGQTAITYLPLTNSAVYSPSASAPQKVDGLLAFQRLAYAPLGTAQVPLYPTTELQNASYVVASQVDSNAATNALGAYAYTTTYGYQQALVNLVGRGWLGFATFTRVDQALGAQTTTTMRQDYPFDGRPVQTITCAAASATTPCLPTESGGSPLRITSYSYRCIDTQADAPCNIDNDSYAPTATRIAQVVVTGTADQDLTLGSNVETHYAYDHFGNRVFTAELGDVATTAHPVYTCARYHNDTAKWRLGYLASRKVSTAKDCTDHDHWDGKRGDLRLGRLDYDDAMHVTTELHWDASHESWLGTAYTYDAYGNQETDSLVIGRKPVSLPWSTYTTAYDATYHSFPITRTTASPAYANPSRAPLVTQLGYDARFGVVVARQDPNGAITNRCVDGFGRLALVQGPAPTGVTADTNCVSTTTYPYLAAAFTGNTATASLGTVSWTATGTSIARTRQARTSWMSPQWMTRTEYVDGLGRLVRTATQDDSGDTLYVDRQYQTPDLLAQQSQPYLSTATPAWNVATYDPLGRLIAATAPYQAPDGTVGTSQTTWSYAVPNMVTETRVVPDGTSYVVASQMAWFGGSRKTITRTTVTDGNATTSFSYDGVGALVGAVAPAPSGATSGVVNTAVLDSLGRRTEHSETNLGSLRTRYNLFGRVDEEVDALGQRVVYAYDTLGRPIRRVAHDGSGAVVERVDLYWDYLPGKSTTTSRAGRLARIDVSNGSAVQVSYDFDYDAYGNEVRREIRFPAAELAPFVMTAAFDPMQRELVRNYPDPDRTSVLRGWGAASGNLLTLAAATASAPTYTTYATYGGYTPFGAPTTLAYGNGASEAWSYDAADRPLGRVVTGPAGTLAASAYGWDPLGNLIDSVDCTYSGNAGTAPCQALGVTGTGTTNHSQTFAYTAQRMTGATGPFGAGGAQASISYDYDQAGNLIASGDTAYTYSGHQVIGGTRSGATALTALYDANGNMCLRVAAASSATTCPAPGAAPTNTTQYQYDPFDRLIAVWNGPTRVESYTYDAGDRRVTKTHYNADGTAAWTAYYVTDELSVQVSAAGTREHQLLLPGLRPRAAVAHGAQPPEILHKDLAYSTTAITDGSGALASTIAYQPYGHIANETPAKSALRSSGFQGQIHDDTGLSLFGRRYQDPALGRFLTADRITGSSTYDQDALDRYEFALGRPATVEDPTGDTPLATMIIIFQTIMDLVAPEDFGTWLEADAALMKQALRMSDEDIERIFQAEVNRVTAGRDVDTGAIAKEAARRVNAAGINNRTLAIAWTDRGVFGDVSGNWLGGDMLRPPQVSDEMTDRYNFVRNLRENDAAETSGTRTDLYARGTKRLRMTVSYEDWMINNCAEFRLFQRLSLVSEQQNALVDVREMYTVYVQSQADSPQCRNCTRLLADVADSRVPSGRAFSRARLLAQLRAQLPTLPPPL
ncbi:MAG: hypothetical protein HOV81_40760, partial [Kofleriaceae bacterium]|nr:hypothetical protein [Kofleriaceae bacterium]